MAPSALLLGARNTHHATADEINDLFSNPVPKDAKDAFIDTPRLQNFPTVGLNGTSSAGATATNEGSPVVELNPGEQGTQEKKSQDGPVPVSFTPPGYQTPEPKNETLQAQWQPSFTNRQRADILTGLARQLLYKVDEEGKVVLQPGQKVKGLRQAVEDGRVSPSVAAKAARRYANEDAEWLKTHPTQFLNAGLQTTSIPATGVEQWGNGTFIPTDEQMRAIEAAYLGQRHYRFNNGMLTFAPGEEAKGVREAMKDHLLDTSNPEALKVIGGHAARLDARQQDQMRTNVIAGKAGEGAELKAMLYGAGESVAKGLAGTLGAPVPGGAAATGWLGGEAYKGVMEHLGNYVPFIDEMNNAAKLHPYYSAAGGMGADALGVTNLARKGVGKGFESLAGKSEGKVKDHMADYFLKRDALPGNVQEGIDVLKSKGLEGKLEIAKALGVQALKEGVKDSVKDAAQDYLLTGEKPTTGKIAQSFIGGALKSKIEKERAHSLSLISSKRARRPAERKELEALQRVAGTISHEAAKIPGIPYRAATAQEMRQEPRSPAWMDVREGSVVMNPPVLAQERGLQKGTPEKRVAMTFDEESTHLLDRAAGEMAGYRYGDIQERVWREAPPSVKAALGRVYDVNSRIERGAEIIRMLDQFSRSGETTEVTMPGKNTTLLRRALIGWKKPSWLYAHLGRIALLRNYARGGGAVRSRRAA